MWAVSLLDVRFIVVDVWLMVIPENEFSLSSSSVIIIIFVYFVSAFR